MAAMPFGHACNPPCELEQMAAHREKRKRMTKAALLADADLEDEAYINARTEADMAESYYATLEAHLRAHGCKHDFSEIANEESGIPEEKVK